MQLPEPWNADTTDTERDEKKRLASPASFFYSQGQAICLSADYFTDDRLVKTARGGVAKKHRLRIHLALFGQLMASFEYMLKDFIARAIDLSDVFDEKVKGASWINVDVERVLAIRTATMSAGAMLVHPTLSWHNTKMVNERYGQLFGASIIKGHEIEALNQLWILRHSVAHNAGFVSAPDAARLGGASLANKLAKIDADFIKQAFDFLKPIAERLAADLGKRVVVEWMKRRITNRDFARDSGRYEQFFHLASYVGSRTLDLPQPTATQYDADFAAAHGPAAPVPP